MNFGCKPTINQDLEPICEVHIFDFNQDIYNENIKIYPQQFIRHEKKFGSLNELKNQIFEDIFKTSSVN